LFPTKKGGIIMFRLLAAMLLATGLMQAQTDSPSIPARAAIRSDTERIAKEVHHELVLLPYYGVFDNLAYQVSPDGTVTLIGQVVRPTFEVGCRKCSETHRGR
jgi:hyperosmotically inducible protein